MVNRSIIVASLLAVFVASPALADDSIRVAPDANADTQVADAQRSARMGIYGTAGFGVFARQQDANDGVSLGGELAYLFDGHQGLRFGYSYGAGIFGPEVNAFDLDYSIQFNTHPHLKHVTASFGALIGPSFGIVSYDGNDPDVHATFGGRVGAFADLNVWMFTVGADASYRVGFSNPYGAESYATFGLHAGITFETSPRAKRL